MVLLLRLEKKRLSQQQLYKTQIFLIFQEIEIFIAFVKIKHDNKEEEKENQVKEKHEKKERKEQEKEKNIIAIKYKIITYE